MWTVLVPFSASCLLIFFQFWYWYGSTAAVLVGFLLWACGLFRHTRLVWYPHYHCPFSFDIKHIQDQAVLKCFILNVKAQWYFEMPVTVYRSTQQNIPEDFSNQQHALSAWNLAGLNFMTRSPHSLSCTCVTKIWYLFRQPSTCNESEMLIHELQ